MVRCRSRGGLVPCRDMGEGEDGGRGTRDGGRRGRGRTRGGRGGGGGEGRGRRRMRGQGHGGQRPVRRLEEDGGGKGGGGGGRGRRRGRGQRADGVGRSHGGEVGDSCRHPRALSCARARGCRG